MLTVVRIGIAIAIAIVQRRTSRKHNDFGSLCHGFEDNLVAFGTGSRGSGGRGHGFLRRILSPVTQVGLVPC